MQHQQSLEFTGWDGARQGMVTALDHANATSLDWGVRAIGMFEEYCRLFGSEPFMTEDVRDWSEGLGLASPPDKRAWGAVAMAARKAGLVRSMGYAPQKSVNAHRAPKTVWSRV
ncbi:hypothetical protein UFOVP1298_24 [uncultured Caudovirales phage]|jgi:propanediol dehydratase large subunit|uniref:Peptidase C37 domain-containing protein n=1 Tax=uncultured Caudovirales phage TaxID=2100421 RepID=A0A6J5RPH3_9CAUD|nr:hypothetical protein UFOVP1298_24 [uncultured Caudovirales phage]